MSEVTNWYNRLHGDEAYGKSSFNIPRLVGSAAFQRWFVRVQSRPVRMLDVGCGKGQFLLDLSTYFRARHLSVTRIVGLDLIEAPQNVFAQIEPSMEFNQQSVDGTKLPYADASFDLISCNHVLEHVFYTENLVREFKRVLTKDGLCVISVPNIAAWMNRIMFLMGGQPLGSEVGAEEDYYGCWPEFVKKQVRQYKPSGHIRDFTPRSLRDLSEACGFRATGWWAQTGGLLCALRPTFDRNLGILLEKGEEHQSNPGTR